MQGRKLDFMDKGLLNDEIGKGAAVVLEGIDILDAAVNQFVARLDEVKWDMLEEWSKTRKAPEHARWMHDGSMADQIPE